MLRFGPEEPASFDESRAAWVLEPDAYGIFLGSSLTESKLAGTLELRVEKMLARMRHICPPQRKIELLKPDPSAQRAHQARLLAEIKMRPKLEYDLSRMEMSRYDRAAEESRNGEAE